MSDVLKFTGNTTLPISAEAILEDAKGWDMRKCLILGWKDGKFIFGGTHCEIGENLILLEMARTKLMGLVDG